MKEIVLEDFFFWGLTRKIRFFANTVSLKLKDKSFMERVRKSEIRDKPWDANCKGNFRLILDKMNEYREDQKKKREKDQKKKREKDLKGKAREDEEENEGAYNGYSLNDYVRLICGACTHWRQIKVML